MTAMIHPVTSMVACNGVPIKRTRPDSSSSIIWSTPVGERYFSRGGGAEIQCCIWISTTFPKA